MSGLKMRATCVTCGAISLSSSKHLPASEDSMSVNPGILPPGLDKLSTKPLPTGSETDTPISLAHERVQPLRTSSAEQETKKRQGAASGRAAAPARRTAKEWTGQPPCGRPD